MTTLLDQAIGEAREILPPEEQDRFAAMIQDAVRARRETRRGKDVSKGKWARAAESIVHEVPLDEACALILGKTSREFREDFAFEHDLDPARK